MWLPIRGTSDMTEATHFSQCVHDQQRRLEADDCDSIRCAQLISGGRRRIRPPCTVPRSRSPTMRCIRLVYVAPLTLYASLSRLSIQASSRSWGILVYMVEKSKLSNCIAYYFICGFRSLKHLQQHTELDRSTVHCVLRGIPRSRFAAKSDNLA